MPSVGELLIETMLPEFKGKNLTKKEINKAFTEIAQKNPKRYSELIDNMTELGGRVSYMEGDRVCRG